MYICTSDASKNISGAEHTHTLFTAHERLMPETLDACMKRSTHTQRRELGAHKTLREPWLDPDAS